MRPLILVLAFAINAICLVPGLVMFKTLGGEGRELSYLVLTDCFLIFFTW